MSSEQGEDVVGRGKGGQGSKVQRVGKRSRTVRENAQKFGARVWSWVYGLGIRMV